MATIIIKNSTGVGVTPTSLQQGELAINTKDGRLFYGSGSGNIVKEFTGSGGGSAISASYALTASYASNGGVTQLLAGPNITLSPTNGLGQVTVSSTAGGGGFNTATGSYGSFYDTTTQTNPVANVPRSMSFDSTDITNGVSISGSTNPFNTYVKTKNAGIYNIQFSAQIDKTDSGADEIVIWLRKNGIDLTDTATTLTLSGNNDKQVAAWNWFVTSAAGDYYQIIWLSADTDLRLLAEPISGTHPGIPSVILTANRVDQFLSNTGSFSGSFNGLFTGSLFGTASWATNALTASFINTASTNAFVQNGNSFGTTALLGTNDNQSLAFETSGSVRMFVSSSGRVGIGNIVPNSDLEIYGVGSSNGTLRLTRGNNNANYVELSGGTSGAIYNINTSGVQDHIFQTGGTERMRISGSGTVGIGNTGVLNTALAITANGSGGGNYIIQGYDASAVNRFLITATGRLQMTGTTDTGTSGTDERVRLTNTFNPTSGTREHMGIYLVQAVSQSGGANGITRGLYIQPTLTSAADYRAIETTSGSISFNHGSIPLLFASSSGKVGIGTLTPASTLSVSGRVGISARLRVGATGDPNSTMEVWGDQIFATPAGGVWSTFVQSTEQLGVGTSSPSSKVHIKGAGATSATTALRVENTNGSASLTIRDDGSSIFTNDLTVTGSILYRYPSYGSFTLNNAWTDAVNNNSISIYDGNGNISLIASPGSYTRSIIMKPSPSAGVLIGPYDTGNGTTWSNILNVSGSSNFIGNVTVTGSLIAPSITGSLQGTASWATNAATASFLLGSVTSASFAATASFLSGRLSVIRSFNTGSIIGPGGSAATASVSLAIPAYTFKPGDMVRVKARIAKVATGGNTTVTIFHNYTNTILGANSLGILTGNTTYMQLERTYNLLPQAGVSLSSDVESAGVGTSLATDNAATNRTITSTDFFLSSFIIIAISNTNAADSAYSTMVTIERI